jgi:hypothetical protein
MTDEHPETNWLTRNWPWWLMIFFLVVYEFWALANHQRTLSRMVWRSAQDYPWMVPIVLSFVAWLLLHFFVTRGKWVIELTWTGVIVAVIWIGYIAF